MAKVVSEYIRAVRLVTIDVDIICLLLSRRKIVAFSMHLRRHSVVRYNAPIRVIIGGFMPMTQQNFFVF